jgi:ribose 5-phosphate isomerase A
MNLKKEAAAKALDYVQSGMVLGLGSGSTNEFFVDMLGDRISSGALNNIKGVPTSDGTAERARKLHIPLTTLSEIPHLDLAVDGADEVDPHFNLIKGLGRAALREKLVEIHARRFVVIVDESKLVRQLGTRGPLPVEIVQFEAETNIRWMNSLGMDCRAEQWFEKDRSPVITDNGNFLVRCWFEDGIADAYQLAETLQARPGVVGHGLFLDMADIVIVAGEDGIRTLEKSS